MRRSANDETASEAREVRAEVLELLRIVREARDSAPWDRRIHDFYASVFPQMTRWLPPAEAALLCDEFDREMERLEILLAA